MQGLRTGLRHRLRRSLARIEHQHRALRRIAGELDRALRARSAARTVDWLERFGEALQAHFDLEESVLFPAVHGLLEDTERELQQLADEHGVFLETLTRVLESVSSGASADPSSTVVALRDRLREHERREEELLSRVIDAHPD